MSRGSKGKRGSRQSAQRAKTAKHLRDGGEKKFNNDETALAAYRAKMAARATRKLHRKDRRK